MGLEDNIYYVVYYVDKNGVSKTQTVTAENLDWFKAKVVSEGGSVMSWERK